MFSGFPQRRTVSGAGAIRGPSFVFDFETWRPCKPQTIRVDNGPEFISRSLDLWAYFNGVKLDLSRPGKPTDNAVIESFNGLLRDECLSQYWFVSLDEARAVTEAWRRCTAAADPRWLTNWLTGSSLVLKKTSTPGWTRTSDPGIRNLMRDDFKGPEEITKSTCSLCPSTTCESTSDFASTTSFTAQRAEKAADLRNPQIKS